jgi:DNA-binding NarL/FixJ family response regulator
MDIRIVIADDHPLVRAAVAELLGDIPDVELVGSAADGNEAVKLVSELRPDLILLDLIMPGMSGFDALSLINEAEPGLCVILLSMHCSEEYVLRALKLGAVGFLLKDSVADELEYAIKAVMSGQTWLSPDISKSVLSAYVERNASQQDSSARLHRLIRHDDALTHSG